MSYLPAGQQLVEIIEQHVTEPPAKYYANCTVENQRFDGVVTQPQAVSPSAPKPPSCQKTNKIHQAVPMNLQWPQRNCHGINVWV